MANDFNTKAIFLDIKSTDSEGKKAKHFKAMRVIPMIHLNYKNVCDYINKIKTPVCSLYNKVYIHQ